MRIGLGAVYTIVLGVTLLAQSGSLQKAAASRPALVQVAPVIAARLDYNVSRPPTFKLPDGQTRVIRSVLNISRQFKFGQFVWNDTDVAKGPVWVRVDLAQQTLSVFRAGHEIGTTVILFGANSNPTPAGVFPVLAKARSHRSSVYYADMPYMMRLTSDGVAIHASTVRKGAATHGCIGVPLEFARLLYAEMRVGDQVAIVG